MVYINVYIIVFIYFTGSKKRPHYYSDIRNRLIN